MHVGIEKKHENEYHIQIGNSLITLDRFNTEMLLLVLENSLESNSENSNSTLQSYISLGLQLKLLNDIDLQKLLRLLDPKDIAAFLLHAQDVELSKPSETF
jgi:hypothetical protein